MGASTGKFNPLPCSKGAGQAILAISWHKSKGLQIRPHNLIWKSGTGDDSLLVPHLLCPSSAPNTLLPCPQKAAACQQLVLPPGCMQPVFPWCLHCASGNGLPPALEAQMPYATVAWGTLGIPPIVRALGMDQVSFTSTILCSRKRHHSTQFLKKN